VLGCERRPFSTAIMSRSCFASFPVRLCKFSSHYLKNIIFIDNSLGHLARESPCICIYSLRNGAVCISDRIVSKNWIMVNIDCIGCAVKGSRPVQCNITAFSLNDREKPQSEQCVSAEIRTMNFPMQAKCITTSQLRGRGADCSTGSLINYLKVLKNHCQTEEARGEIVRRMHY
jgi:hypothetical protein